MKQMRVYSLINITLPKSVDTRLVQLAKTLNFATLAEQGGGLP
jgi:hypothetical protein